ncbi:RNA-guided endonuclease TnpB family protein [Streptomyces mirabilis]|uniref:RNA-guided endonuclease TnpB family protein n=1 Tax=Streptomyces mirabilis TaxID=68239 RepID=UPI0036CA1C24
MRATPARTKHSPAPPSALRTLRAHPARHRNTPRRSHRMRFTPRLKPGALRKKSGSHGSRRTNYVIWLGCADGGTNRARARLKVAKIHARIADRRRDTLHRLTTRLVRENQTIVIEDLTVRNMVKNHRLARAISDAAWSESRRMLEYKAQWYGREVIAVDRWFPSSRLCSACGILRDTMPLNIRTWTCDCGVTHDRDVNAAHNLLAAGLAVTVCGAGVRPQRSTPEGQSATKQKPSRREP